MPSMPVEILPIAEDDVSQALAYIAADDLGAAGRLLDNLLEALDRVSRHPLSGVEITVGGRRSRRYRQLYVRPYHIYYRVIDEKIVVMRVLHERMDIRRHLP